MPKPPNSGLRFLQPTPELPVADVRAAQRYYAERLGFEIAWYNAEGRIGAVARDDCALFFRAADGAIAPAVFWLFVEDVDAAFAAFKAGGAEILAPPENTSWGLRQFTLQDLNSHRFHVFHDL